MQRTGHKYLLRITKIITTVFIVSYTWLNTASATTYYVSSSSGDDEYTGTDPDSAWKDLTRVNDMNFQAGDFILFKAGDIWNGQLWPKGSGTPASPIVIGRYGPGANPVLSGGEAYTIYLFNQEYWQIDDLEITNYKADDTSYKRGIWIQAKDYGPVHNIHLKNLTIHDVNGNIAPGNDSKHNGAIFFQVSGSSKATYFDDILIEGCYIYDVARTGISLNSSWATRTLTTNTDWTPSRNVIIRNNTIERTAGNGLIWRVSHRPLVEYNVFHECATILSGNAMFFFNCDSATAQFNEAYLTVYNPGDTDAGAFDADYRCKNTIYQYNYSHDNGEAAFVAPSNGGSATAFQDGAVFRYNISQNDKREVFHVSGPITNTTFYNNTVYIGPEMSDIIIVYHKSWGGYPKNTSYYNNIIYNEGRNCRYTFGGSTNNVFDYNVFYGNHPGTEPYDSHKITDDPLFIFPGSGGIGIETVNGYKLEKNSPCIDSGLLISDHGGRDYWDNPVPSKGIPDRGAFEYQAGNAVAARHRGNMPNETDLLPNYPNPFNPVTHIRFSLAAAGHITLIIYNVRGQIVHTLLDGIEPAGQHTIVWNGRDGSGNRVSAGIYYCSARTQAFTKTIKMLLLP